MAKKQVNPAHAAFPEPVVAPAPEPLVAPMPEPATVPVEVLPTRTTAVVQLRSGYTQCRSAGVVFGPDPVEFALDDYRLPEFRACKYLEVT